MRLFCNLSRLGWSPFCILLSSAFMVCKHDCLEYLGKSFWWVKLSKFMQMASSISCANLLACCKNEYLKNCLLSFVLADWVGLGRRSYGVCVRSFVCAFESDVPSSLLSSLSEEPSVPSSLLWASTFSMFAVGAASSLSPSDVEMSSKLSSGSRMLLNQLTFG